MTQPEQMRHELLIRVDEQLKAVARDVQEVKNGYGAHLALLDANKMDKADFANISKDIESLKKDMDSQKSWRWYTAGGVVVLTVILLPILAWALSKITDIDSVVEQAVTKGVSASLSAYEKPQ